MDKAYDISTTPEPGQLVQVRSRQWSVAEVQASYTANSSVPPQHLVTLSSIEDDALGEELSVVWQIEPGARVIEKAGLPEMTGVDDADTLEAFLDAVRWGAATNADKGFLQAPFRSGIVIEAHQLDPLFRSIEMARVNLLIADDVGLGKTIEAGLVVQEMLLRHRARTVMIVCPASLQQKWADEMLQKFGLEFRIVDTAYLKALRRSRGLHANPWTTFPRLITSIDWVKSGEALRQLREALPVELKYPRKFDMLIVDEAHNVAPSGSKHYISESLRTKLIREVTPHFQHRLFLTATPHNGYSPSFTSLLELLDDQRFARTIEPDPEQLAKVMVRRLKSELPPDASGKPLYPKRVLNALEVHYSDDERKVHKLLDKYCSSRNKTAEGHDIGTSFVNGLLKKRLFSSPAAFAATIEKHYTTITQGKKAKTTSRMDHGILRRSIQRTEEDYADDSALEDALEEATEQATRQSMPLTDSEADQMEGLRKWAQANRYKADSKAKTIIDWLNQHLKTDGKWNNKRVILFTEYRATHSWLHEILVSHDFGGDRLELLHGGTDHDKREEIKASFQTHPDKSPARILLATDAASEGIDLQNYCNYMIHLEIPYNPNVMEQRNGRIDRYGQREPEVHIWHPVDGGSADGKKEDSVGGHKDDIIRALTKLETMRADMGSVNPVIAPQFSGLIEGAISELDTKVAEARAAKTRKYFAFDRKIQERIAEAHQRLEETRNEYHLNADHIYNAVKTGLQLAKKPALQPARIKDAPENSVFTMPELGGSWSECGRGLEHPHTKEIRPITFDHDVAKGRDDVVLVHLNHKLVQNCLRSLREQIWSTGAKKDLHRITAKVIDDETLEAPAIVVQSRLVIVGGNYHRLHEELTSSGGLLTDKAFRVENSVTTIGGWLSNSQPTSISAGQLDALRIRYERHQDAIFRRAESRSTERLRNLTNTLERKKAQEISDISSVLDELAAYIQAEFDKSKEPEQLALSLDDDERFLARRDWEALKSKLEKIPQEKEQETKAIEDRYGEFHAYTFPAAVTLILPKSVLE